MFRRSAPFVKRRRSRVAGVVMLVSLCASCLFGLVYHVLSSASFVVARLIVLLLMLMMKHPGLYCSLWVFPSCASPDTRGEQHVGFVYLPRWFSLWGEHQPAAYSLDHFQTASAEGHSQIRLQYEPCAFSFGIFESIARNNLASSPSCQ